MKRSLIILLLVVLCGLFGEAVHAQTRTSAKIDFSRSRFDSTTIELCHEFIDHQIYKGLAISRMHPRLIPAFIATIDYPAKSYPPQFKLIYSSDGVLGGELAVVRRLENGEWKKVASSTEVAPGSNVKLRLKDLTGDGRAEVIAISRGDQPIQQSFTAMTIDTSGNLVSIVNRPKGPHDTQGTLGVAVAVIDSLTQDGCPVIEVWQDDGANFAKNYVRIRHRYDKAAGKFNPATFDTLQALPMWCDGRRSQYSPKN